MGPNEEKLRKKLEEQVANGMQNMHIDWTKGGLACSSEERCAIVLDMFAEIEAWDALSVEEQMQREIILVHEHLVKAVPSCFIHINDINETFMESKDCKDMLEVGAAIEISLIKLGNWLAGPLDESKMKTDIKESYSILKKAIRLCKINVGIEGWHPMSETRSRLLTAHGYIDISLLTLGNWISTSERTEILKSIRSIEV